MQQNVATPEHRPLANLLMPLALAGAIAALGQTARVQSNALLSQSFLGATVAVAAWSLLLTTVPKLRRSAGKLEISLRAQHYIQACCQFAVYAYWGWYWRPVYDMGVLIGAQVLFASAFAILQTEPSDIRRVI